MESLPLIRASQIRPFVVALEQLGLPVERHLRRARLPLAWQDRPDALVAEQLIRVLREGEQVADRQPDRPVQRSLLEQWLESLRS